MYDALGYPTGDKHYHEHKSKIEVTENKAPTDESIRIFKELEEKAKKSVLDSYKCENNVFKCTAVWLQSGVVMHSRVSATDIVEFNARFSINGREYRVSKEITGEEYFAFKRTIGLEDKYQLIMKYIGDEVSKVVTMLIMSNFPVEQLKRM